MNEDTSLVSVIIPVYNKEEELKRALNSVLKQTYQNFEIIVVDDYSTEDIQKTVAGFKDERIKYYKLKKKGNANIARNMGIQKASGEYTAMLDSDDEWLSVHLERRVQKFRDWDCDGIYGSAVVFDESKRQNLYSRSLEKGESMINYLLSENFSATTPSHFYKTECAKEILWDENLLRHQDLDFTCRFSDRFRFLGDEKPTVVIHRKGKKTLKNEHFNSCVKFINKNIEQIDIRLYANYLAIFLQYAIISNSKKYIRYYKKEISKNIAFFSLNRYLSANLPQNKFARLILRLKFIYKTLIN